MPVIRAKVPTRGTGWVVTRYDDVMKVHKDPRFSTDPRNAGKVPLFGFGGPYAPRLIKLVGASMVSVDDPAHARLRRLVSKVFTPRSIDDMTPWVETLVGTMLDEAARRGAIDLMAEFALPLPLSVISEMLGIPEEWRLSFHHQVVRLIEVNDKPVRRAIRWLPAMPKTPALLRRSARAEAPRTGRQAHHPADRGRGGRRSPQPRRADRHDFPAALRRPRDLGEPHRQRADGLCSITPTRWPGCAPTRA